MASTTNLKIARAGAVAGMPTRRKEDGKKQEDIIRGHLLNITIHQARTEQNGIIQSAKTMYYYEIIYNVVQRKSVPSSKGCVKWTRNDVRPCNALQQHTCVNILLLYINIMLNTVLTLQSMACLTCDQVDRPSTKRKEIY